MSTLADWVVEEQLVTSDQLVQAQQLQMESAVALTTALLELELVDEGALVDLIARRNSLPKAPKRMHRITVSSKALSMIPQDYCWQHGLFPFGVDPASHKLQIAIVDPSDPEAIALLKKLVRQEFQLYVAGPRQVEKAIRKHFLDSWIDESAASAPRRFFGYENITNPGVRSKRQVEPREPSPVVGHGVVDPSQTGPLGAERPPGASPSAAPNEYGLLWGDAARPAQPDPAAVPAAAERARSLTPPPQVPIASIPTPAATAQRRATGPQQQARPADLQLRVESLERAMAELLAVLGAGSQDTAGRIAKIGAALRRALDNE